MDEEQSKQHQEALKNDTKAYKCLKRASESEEVNEILELFIRTASQKMTQAFTADAIKSWDDFCKFRGEIQAYLYPIQEVKGADAMVKRLEEQLKEYYNM